MNDTLKNIGLNLSLASLLFSFASSAEQTQLSKLHKQQTIEATGKIKAFAVELKDTLKTNIEHGGLKQGIEVCKKMAIPIAQKHSTDGWQLKRTSLKLRNTLNAPDVWEIEQLNNFERQKLNGKNINKLVVTTTTDTGVFRLMKAIPTGEVCLKCHGKNISSEVKNSLGKNYPQDIATDFSLGDIRGAFSIIKKIENE